MNTSVGIVLLHGAGLGQWIWHDAMPSMKVPVLAINFPERDAIHGVNPSVTLEDYCAHCIRQIHAWKCHRFVLVAHSISGVVALKLAKYFGSQVAGLMGVGAIIPKRGGSFLSALPFPARILTNIMMRVAGTRPPQSAILSGLCDGLSTVQSERIVRNYVPESAHLYFDAAHAPIPETRRAYVRLTSDHGLTSSMQDRMIRHLGAEQIFTISSGHMPMLQYPDQLATIINNFVDEVSPTMQKNYPHYASSLN